MFFLNVSCGAEEKDMLIAELWGNGSTGIVESDQPGGVYRLRAFFENDSDADALIATFGGEREAADNRNWVESAREMLPPMAVGSRFFLVPEWRDDPAPNGRFRIFVNSGLAFGTGAHETTRLCLELLERYVKPGMTVVDVGTGSGILSEAAALLGAKRVFACDVDENAVSIANRRFHETGIRAIAFTGSAPSLRSGIADLVVANISPEWIVGLAAEWFRLLRPGGTVILSGFEAED
ncbi:MAG: 50S ribosomal protein L11 methyltransferase, partial [Acidobacteriota bacterium]|nr:50S ribosomal protein L11 methyltransferase [Acidobacteriota bacterium]